MRPLLATAVLLGFVPSAAAADDAPRLVNGSFEDGPSSAPAGWEIAEGARSGGGPAVASTIEVDATAARTGSRSLRLASTSACNRWPMLRQTVPMRAADRVTLTVAVRGAGLRLEPGAAPFTNANATLEFLDAKGARLALLGSPLAANGDWATLTVGGDAPPGTAHARAGLILSVPGTMWCDDVALTVVRCDPETPEGRGAVFDRVEERFLRDYPFFGVAGRPSAEDVFAGRRERFVAARGAAGVVAELRDLLAPLDDVHVNLETPEGFTGTARPSSAPSNRNARATRAALHDVLLEETNLLVGRLGAAPDAPGYVGIGSWRLDAAAVARLETAIDGLAACRGLVVDVRPNGGGDETWAARIAGRFAAQPVVFGRFRVRDPAKPRDPAAFLPATPRVLHPRRKGDADARPVVVLQGPYCVSSNEAFVQMMAALPQVTTVGLPTRGASANPAPLELFPGARVHVPRWQAVLLDGTLLEGRGVAPEVRVEAPAGSHAHADPTLEEALEILRR